MKREKRQNRDRLPSNTFFEIAQIERMNYPIALIKTEKTLLLNPVYLHSSFRRFLKKITTVF